MKLFHERGYAATSVADICAAADVSRATFFIYFPAKSALIGEVSRKMGEAWDAQSGALLDRPVLARLRALADFMFDNTLDPQIITPMLNDFRATFGPDTAPGTGEGTMHGYATALISEAQSRCLLTKDIPAEDLAHHLIRTTGIQKLLVEGAPDDLKARNWRLFAQGAAP